MSKFEHNPCNLSFPYHHIIRYNCQDMQKFSDFLVKHCYVIFTVFLVLTGICGILATKVNINKDIYSYMPADSETSHGLEIMDNEFNYSSTSSYEIMLTDVPQDEKQKIKSHIESITGVKSVDYDETDSYNRDPYTRYAITVDAPADSDTANQVYKEIHDTYSAKYEYAAAGQVHEYNGTVLQIEIAVLAVAFAMVILIIMSKSWVEPFLFLFASLLAVVVNKGTNIIFPNVSHITDAICAVLQMALSMDYAIMLSTRYRQEKAKKDCKDKQTAMRRAMRYSFGAICSSSITTVVGLLVLIFMSFTIGRDMGLVLSKGVVLSLVSIFTSLPALLLIFDKAIDKTAKKTFNFKMKWAGHFAYKLSRFALPLFLLIFAGAFLLKGSTTIDFTASKNNKIKDVFDQTNQMVIVYDNDLDSQVTDLCYDLDSREETTSVLCYGNTINEPEHYNEVVPKVNELKTDQEPVDTEDYLIKALFYHYYKDVDAHAISLDNFVKYLQNDVFPSDRFADEVDSQTIAKVNQLSYFTDQIKVNQPRTKSEIANILEVDSAKLDDVFVLYLAEQDPTVRLTTYQFARFVTDEVLTNPRYSSMVTASQRSDLHSLLLFSDSSFTDTPKSAAELASIFGIDQSVIEQILTYYTYTTTTNPTATATIEQLINFALTDPDALAALGLSSTEATELLQNFNDFKTTLIEERQKFETWLNATVDSLPEDTEAEIAVKEQLKALRDQIIAKIADLETILTSEYSYDDIVSFATKVDQSVANLIDELNNLDLSSIPGLSDEIKATITEYAAKLATAISNARTEFNLPDKLSQLKQLYTLYQAKTTSYQVKLSPRELVDFLLEHRNDDRLKGAMTPDIVAKLSLVQFIMQHQSTAYSYRELASTFGLDQEKLRLVYALYEYRYINPNPKLSLKTLVNFLESTVLPNPEYANRLTADERTKISTIATLMHAAEAGTPFTYDALYQAILPLAQGLDKNKLFLAYLYHGSLYDYDESWTLTLEKFINFLGDDVITDSRFASRLDDSIRQTILDGQQTIKDSKELLVGPKHSRALIESHLPSEGEQTFSLIKSIKDQLGPTNNVNYYLVGDSAMAYEMSQTFSGEMDFITLITMLAIFAVVVCTFRSVFVSLLLVLVIQCAVYIVMSYLSLTGSSIYFIALIIVQAILMGATIDYAILFTSYYIENRTQHRMGVKNALISTYQKSISAILTSASILIIVTAIVGNLTSAIAGMICQSISLGTFCATVIILVLLPALLATLDRWIIKRKK